MTDAYRTLAVGSSGPDVRALHARLLDHAAHVERDELVAGMFGQSTRHELLGVQRRLDLLSTGAADSETLQALARSDVPAHRYVVGQVLGPDERPVVAARIEALDRDLRSSERLGLAQTDEDGAFVVVYDLAAAAQREAGNPDVYVTVRLGRRLVHDPPVEDTVFHAPVLVSFVVRLDTAEAPDATEWRRVTTAVEPLLGRVAWTDLAEDDEHRDVTFLAGETGFDPAILTAAVLARRLGDATQLEPQLFYAVLVEGVLANATRWASLTPRLQLTTSADTETLLDDIVLLPTGDVVEAVRHAAATFPILPWPGPPRTWPRASTPGATALRSAPVRLVGALSTRACRTWRRQTRGAPWTRC
jgi:hypothetical protein